MHIYPELLLETCGLRRYNQNSNKMIYDMFENMRKYGGRTGE